MLRIDNCVDIWTQIECGIAIHRLRDISARKKREKWIMYCHHVPVEILSATLIARKMHKRGIIVDLWEIHASELTCLIRQEAKQSGKQILQVLKGSIIIWWWRHGTHHKSRGTELPLNVLRIRLNRISSSFRWVMRNSFFMWMIHRRILARLHEYRHSRRNILYNPYLTT